MAFEIGETVTPVANLNSDGVEIPTLGIEGIVLARNKVGEDDEGNPYYVYQVQLSEVVTYTIPSGAEQSGQIFWFSESDLGAEGESGYYLDPGEVSSSISTSKGVSDDAASTIAQMKSSVPTINPYYDILKNFEGLAQGHSDDLAAVSVDSGDPDSDYNKQGVALVQQSNNFSSDSEIIKELAENVYGFYTVTAEVEADIKKEQEQAEVQDQLAVEEDTLIFSTFVNVYIDSPEVTGLMEPNFEESPKQVKGLSDVDGLDSINPADLITETIDLEQD